MTASTTAATPPWCGDDRGRRVSERKRAEEALAEARRRSETILESITDAYVSVDRDWRFTYINDRALRRMQVRAGGPVTREEMLGRNMWDAFPDAVGTELHRRYSEAMGGQGAVEFETYFDRVANGSRPTPMRRTRASRSTTATSASACGPRRRRGGA
jgi:PAS domain S-box-containing protein